jgi:hypothetical protein
MTKALLKLVMSWQRAALSHLSTSDLADSHFLQPCLQIDSEAQKSQVVRSVILQILTLYLCEQRGIIARGQLQALQQKDALLSHLTRLWQSTQIPLLVEFEISAGLPDGLLSQFIGSLYASRLNFSIPALGQVYETLLTADALGCDRASSHQKTGGVYYTPEAIVGYVLQMTLGRLLGESQSDTVITLLDPSCGCGAFLISAYQFLLDWYLRLYSAEADRQKADHQKADHQKNDRHLPIKRGQDDKWQLTRSERERLLLTQIYGVDLDPQAVEITQLGLYLLVLGDSSDRAPLPNLSHNIQCGNAVIEAFIEAVIETVSDTGQPRSDRPFNWQQAFPEILQSGGFDLVIGNPPYLDSEGMTTHLPDWRRYCAANYQTATGNWDLFCVFIEKALTLCKPGGFTSLVVPNKLASANYAARARSLLIQQTNLLAIRDYSNVSVFRAAVYPLVYVAQKLDEQNIASVGSISYERMQSLEQVGVAGRLLLNSATQPWQMGVTGESYAWINRLQTFPPLESIAQVTGAATVAEAYALQPLLQDSAAIALGDLRLVNSGTIDRYCFLWGKKPLRYLGQVYLHPVLTAPQILQLSPRRKQQAQQPKIIVAGLSQVLECGLDEIGSVLAGKSTSVIRANFPLDLRYLLGLLNSHLLSVYVQSCFAGNCLQGGYLRIGAPQLRQLPMWIPDLADAIDRQHYNQLIVWVSDRLSLQSQFMTLGSPNSVKIQAEIDRLDHEIDHHVYRLYQLNNSEIDRLWQSAKSVKKTAQTWL